MKGLGDFQRAQMRDADPRLPELFDNLRHAIELFEQIMLRPHKPAAEHNRATKEAKSRSASIPSTDAKVSYTIKEVRKLVGISNTTVYQVLGRGELKAVKLGKKTLILAKDLHEWLDSLQPMR